MLGQVQHGPTRADTSRRIAQARASLRSTAAPERTVARQLYRC
jgi:hypothetical protein